MYLNLANEKIVKRLRDAPYPEEVSFSLFA